MATLKYCQGPQIKSTQRKLLLLRHIDVNNLSLFSEKHSVGAKNMFTILHKQLQTICFYLFFIYFFFYVEHFDK